jgi:hypothetical protein
MANGLLNLQTDLKSLRYGSDKPYITKDVNDPPSSNQTGMQITKRIDDTSRIAQMLIDRPGLKYLGNEALLQQINVGDRIKKAKSKGKTTVGAVLQQAGNTLVSTAKIVGSTLAQVPVNGTGTHFLKGFRTDTYLRPDPEGVQPSGFAAFFGAGGVEGAPYALNGAQIPMYINSDMYDEKTDQLINTSSLGYDEKINSPIPQGENRIYSQQGTSIIEDNVGIEGWRPYTSLGVRENLVSRDDNTVISQSKFSSPEITDRTRVKPSGSIVSVSGIEILSPNTGTPLTIPGIETTASPNRDLKNPQSTIKSIPNTNVVGSGFSFKDNNLENKYSSGSTYAGNTTQETVLGASAGSIPLRNFTSPNSEIKSRPITGSGNDKVVDANSVNRNVSDFRTGPTSFNYSSPTINKETRINLGNQGKNTGAVSYSTIDRDKIDELNALDVSNSRIDGTNAARDLAKFYFEIITPDETKFLHFRAHIDSIDDSYSGDWDSHQYVGRAEEFFTYKGFKRDISVGFKISAQSRAEMKPLYRKMVYLASATAPTYGGGSNFMRGTLARLTIGSYFSQIPGIITSVKYTWQTDYMWEIAMQNPEGGIDDDQQELPMTLDCSISFKPIHDFAPQTGLKHYFTSPAPLNGSKPFF